MLHNWILFAGSRLKSVTALLSESEAPSVVTFLSRFFSGCRDGTRVKVVEVLQPSHGALMCSCQP